MLNVRAGAMAGVAAEEWHSDGASMTATGSPRHKGRNWSTRFGPIVINCLIQLSWDPYPSPLRQRMLQCRMQKRLMRIETDIVNVEMVTDDGGRIPAQISRFHNVKICRILVTFKDYVDKCSKDMAFSRTALFMASKLNLWGTAVLARGA